jgi:hypothetical protein
MEAKAVYFTNDPSVKTPPPHCGETVAFKDITIGQYADYFDTGIWSLVNGNMVGPEDLTIRQLKDHLTASGGFVYLGKDNRFRWVPRG